MGTLEIPFSSQVTAVSEQPEAETPTDVPEACTQEGTVEASDDAVDGGGDATLEEDDVPNPPAPDADQASESGGRSDSAVLGDSPAPTPVATPTPTPEPKAAVSPTPAAAAAPAPATAFGSAFASVAPAASAFGGSASKNPFAAPAKNPFAPPAAAAAAPPAAAAAPAAANAFGAKKETPEEPAPKKRVMRGWGAKPAESS